MIQGSVNFHFSADFMPQDICLRSELSTAVVSYLLQNLPTLMTSGDIANMKRDPDVTRSAPLVHHSLILCPLAGSRLGSLRCLTSIRSKSCSEHTCSSAQLSTKTCATCQSSERFHRLRVSCPAMLRIAAKMYPASGSSYSKSSFL